MLVEMLDFVCLYGFKFVLFYACALFEYKVSSYDENTQFETALGGLTKHDEIKDFWPIYKNAIAKLERFEKKNVKKMKNKVEKVCEKEAKDELSRNAMLKTFGILTTKKERLDKDL